MILFSFRIPARRRFFPSFEAFPRNGLHPVSPPAGTVAYRRPSFQAYLFSTPFFAVRADAPTFENFDVLPPLTFLRSGCDSRKRLAPNNDGHERFPRSPPNPASLVSDHWFHLLSFVFFFSQILSLFSIDQEFFVVLPPRTMRRFR